MSSTSTPPLLLHTDSAERRQEDQLPLVNRKRKEASSTEFSGAEELEEEEEDLLSDCDSMALSLLSSSADGSPQLTPSAAIPMRVCMDMDLGEESSFEEEKGLLLSTNKTFPLLRLGRHGIRCGSALLKGLATAIEPEERHEAECNESDDYEDEEDSAPVSINEVFPDEILFMVLYWLNGKDVGLSAAPVCKRWYYLTTEDYFWKALVYRDHGAEVQKPPEKSWLWFYRSKTVLYKEPEVTNATGVGTNGTNYEGEWKDGKFHGFGTQTWKEAVYVGEFVNGKREGQGKQTWDKGDVYEGQWKDGNPHGFGYKTWPCGDTYVGDWEEGHRMGFGEYTWPSGHRYKGEWRNKLQSGRGVYTWSDGRCYDGEWTEGEKHGMGKYSWPNGCCYEGPWNEGKRHGPQGKMTWPDGTYFVGRWEFDVRREGTSYEKDGTPAFFNFPLGSKPLDDYFSIPDDLWDRKYGPSSH
ncbi:MORN repeat-containing protein [Balamuthia mandrillaris]